MKRLSSAIMALLLAAPLLVEAGGISGGIQVGIGAQSMRGGSSVPEPRLLSPVSETVDMTAQETLEFKWSPFEGKIHKRRSYEFRLYKGREQYEKNEVYRKDLAAGEYAVILKTDMFEDGQVYTWAVRQVYYQGKSDWAYSSFKAIKKARGPETK